MTEKIRWIDNSYQALKHLIGTFIAYFAIPANLVRFGFDENTVLGKWFKTEVLPAITAYNSAYTSWENEKTRDREKIDAISKAKDDLVPLVKNLEQLLQAFPPSIVTDLDLDLMGFPKRPSGKRVPAPVAAKVPGYAVGLPEAFRVQIFFFDKDRGSGKPDGQHGVEIASLATTATEGIVHADLIQSSFDTNSPCTFDFPDTDRGKRFYFSLRWENSRGEKGPWTPVDFAVIP
jgi:hypothetical protein